MRKLVALLIFCATVMFGFTQELTNEQIKLFRDADDFLLDGRYAEAKPLYRQLDESIDLPDLHYKIAYCDFHLPGQQKEAIIYFESYLSEDDSLNEAYYLLGILYHQDYQFARAMEMYALFKETIDSDPRMTMEMRAEIHEMIDRQISYCNYALIAMDNPRDVVVENVGEEVNSEFPEYAPVISLDEHTLIVTSRRPDTEGGKVFGDGKYYEDIYTTTLEKGSLFIDRDMDPDHAPADFIYLVTDFAYEEIESVNNTINTKKHEGAIQLSNDGTELYFYRDNDVWKSTRQDSIWGEPERMGENINSRSYEPSVYFALDGQSMYVVSDREGGYGGLDIYRATKEGNEWTDLVNLGPNINSSYDEDAPYLDPSGEVLYFSSKGHSSMGGYDVFRSKLKNGLWSAAANIGFPVNSPGDDIYYVMTPRYNRAYYSSNRIGGHGDMDVYRITFADERIPLAEILGLVLEGDEMVPANSKITLRDNYSFEPISTQNSDTLTGDYLLLVGHGKKYDMVVETEGFVPYLKTFDIPEQKEYYQLYQEIHHVYLYDEDGNIIGQVVTMYNAFFDVEAQVEVDSAIYYYENKAQLYSEYIEKIKEHPEYYEFMDVKYYVTEDEYMRLIEKDSTLHVIFPEYAKVSFLDAEGVDMMNLNNYAVFSDSGYVPGSPIVMNQIYDIETLEQVMDATDPEGVSHPDIVLYFDYENVNLSNEANAELDIIYKFLVNHPELNLKIEGHTDAMGTVAYNNNLSMERARSVLQYLTSKGIINNRLSISALGESDPIAPNANADGSDNPEGRRMNRRVEFVFQD